MIIMRMFLKLLLIIVIGVVCVSALFSFLGAVLGFTFGIIGTVLGFVWRVIFSPVLLILLILFIVNRVNKSKRSKG